MIVQICVAEYQAYYCPKLNRVVRKEGRKRTVFRVFAATRSIWTFRGFPKRLTDIKDVGGVCGVFLCFVDVVDLMHAAQGTQVIFVIVDLDMGAIKADRGREVGG